MHGFSLERRILDTILYEVDVDGIIFENLLY
jgi:hypothetical protein